MFFTFFTSSFLQEFASVKKIGILIIKNTDFFLDTRAINGHSVNVLEKKDFDFRITHRFGNIATPESYRTLFGLDNSSDIRIGFEYGISDKFMLG